jgi:zinc transporter ZupT
MPIVYYLILIVAVTLGGLAFFFFGQLPKKTLKLLLNFSAAYLFALSVLHLIPEVYASPVKNIGVFVIIGFFLQIVLETMSEGIEHGHIHVHKNHAHALAEKSHSKNASANLRFPLAMMVGLCIHSFLEGMPLAQHYADANIQRSLLGGIILHHIPVALALVSMLVDSGISKRAVIFYLFVFVIMAPAGAFAGETLNAQLATNLASVFDRLMAVVIGIFLHISTTILFESDEQHHFNYFKLIIIFLGAGLAYLVA